MNFFWAKNGDLEAQGDGDATALSLVRDKNGNWVNEVTGEIYVEIRESEDEDDANT